MNYIAQISIYFLIFFLFTCTDNSAAVFDPSITQGCMDDTACNYDPKATIDDGGCLYSLDDSIENISDGCDLPENTLHLNDDNVILYNSSNSIGGMQFSLFGGTILSAQGGDVEAAGFDISTDGEIILVYSLTGQDLLAGCGNLMELEIEGEPTGLSNIIISDPIGQEIDFTYHGGCDCDGNILDDCNICGGNNLQVDCLGVCDGLAQEDCFGTCGGDAILDGCGVCGGDSEFPCADCFGEPGGTAQISECLGCADYPYYTYSCVDIAVLEQIINGNETFSGLEPWQLGNTQFWNDDGRIYSLDLSSHQLTTIPDEIGNLEFLEYLSLRNNDLLILPDAIGNLENLEYLYLQENNLTTLPNTIGNLENLEYLNLTENDITSLPESIANLSNLIELDLHQNNLTVLPEYIGSLTSLESFNLSYNQLSQIPESIGNLANLEYLSISNNQIFLSSLPDAITNLNSLITLEINNNIISSLPDDIGNLSNLRLLNGNSNELNSLPSSLCNLHADCLINLGNNDLCDETLLLFPCIDMSNVQDQSGCGE